MKPLPNLDDTAAMVLRGQRSTLGAARNEAAAALRDACTHVQSADWGELVARAREAQQAADQLISLALLWEGLN